MADTIIETVVRNVTNGPKVLNSIPPGLLAAGDSTDEPVKLTEAEYEIAKGTGWFKFGADPLDHDENGKKGGSKPAEPVSLTGKNKAELLEIAKAEGVTVEEGATNADIASAIELAREEAAGK